jgi:hypothetical protein
VAETKKSLDFMLRSEFRKYRHREAFRDVEAKNLAN